MARDYLLVGATRHTLRVPIVGEIKRSVLANGDADGLVPDLTFAGDESGQKVFIAAVGMAILHGDVNDFVAGAVGAIPCAAAPARQA